MHEGAEAGEAIEEVITEDIEEEPTSIILELISQLSIGMDLTKISFPTFVLEPRSLLERITDFMSHQDNILSTSVKEDSLDRFLDVVRYYLSGWHIQPKGVKKPYNPILGEYFRGHWECRDGSTSYYIAEQISHHPPLSAYFMSNPSNNLIITGNFKPRTKFLGNTIQSQLEGQSRVYFLNRPGEEYFLTNPTVYARGILVGRMFLELGDAVTIECPSTGFAARIEFVVKGYFTGEYNAIEGSVTNTKTGQPLYRIFGKWSDKISIVSVTPNAEPVLFFDASQARSTINVPSISAQDRYESRRLWQAVSEAIRKKDHQKAADEKHVLEEEQRHLAKVRMDNGLDWQPNFFKLDPDGEWSLIEKNMFTEGKENLDRHISAMLTRHDFMGSSGRRSHS